MLPFGDDRHECLAFPSVRISLAARMSYPQPSGVESKTRFPVSAGKSPGPLATCTGTCWSAPGGTCASCLGRVGARSVELGGVVLSRYDSARRRPS